MENKDILTRKQNVKADGTPRIDKTYNRENYLIKRTYVSLHFTPIFCLATGVQE